MDVNLNQQPNKGEIGRKMCSVLHDEVQVSQDSKCSPLPDANVAADKKAVLQRHKSRAEMLHSQIGNEGLEYDQPHSRSNKLQKKWTDTIYKAFRYVNACCTLIFKYHHLKLKHSRKTSSPYLSMKAMCSFTQCRAIYHFTQ